MHITEGIITGTAAAAYTGAGLALVGWGTVRMKDFVEQSPENKALLGMGGALIFFISLVPLPTFTGTCSHPCGTPLIAILLGPVIGIGLTGISLLLQAAFFAHGGFGTWGANVVALGLFGCGFGWGAFRLARKAGAPIWLAGCAGGLLGDLAVYAASATILGSTLSQAPLAQYSFGGYLSVIAAAYLPTQLPIAVGEMIVTGAALHFAYRQRPDVLTSLGVVSPTKGHAARSRVAVIAWVAAAGMLAAYAAPPVAAAQVDEATISRASNPGEESTFAGMDEAVNERLAADAGRPPRDPFIDTESMGDLWNLLLLAAGGGCGFVVGRWWHLLWGRRSGKPGPASEASPCRGRT
jgi:cobalt/nickel transport system permease protein